MRTNTARIVVHFIDDSRVEKSQTSSARNGLENHSETITAGGGVGRKARGKMSNGGNNKRRGKTN